jgi:hypothetical protein
MTTNDRRCLRCQTELEPGYLLDKAHHNTRSQTSWVAGPPEPSFWTGLKIDERSVRPVFADRCPDCGRVELYA